MSLFSIEDIKPTKAGASALAIQIIERSRLEV